MESKDVFVLGVRRIDYKDKETQETIQGIKVFYTDSVRDFTDDMKGFNPMSAWLSIEKFEQFKESQVPGRYKMLYELKLDAGKPKVVIKDFEFISLETEILA